MKNQKGQIILILILVMTVALAIGVSAVQRSLTDISTASKVEQSSRAFSAAEAGIESMLSGGTATTIDFAATGAKVNVAEGALEPCLPGSSGCSQRSGDKQAALEYPALAEEEVAQVWLANFNSSANPPEEYYKYHEMDVYWGTKNAFDKTALELTLVYYQNGQYQPRKWYLDNSSAGRSSANNFTQVNCTTSLPSPFEKYQCKYTIGGGDDEERLPSASATLILLRARLLYNNSLSQLFAVQATNPCNQCRIPPQARKYTAVGTAGTTQRKVEVFRQEKVVPFYFDYAIFSAEGINK